MTQKIATGLREEWRRLGQPALYSREDRWLTPETHISPVGMTCAGILGRLPEAAVLPPRRELLAVFAALLGPGFVLELGAGVVSDRSRPFFFWHHHVGGIDGEDWRDRPYPTYDRPVRLGCTLYCDPLDDDHGVMLLWPRALTAPTAPPFPPGAAPWPGARELRAPAGSVVLLDQGTWHAVTPMTRLGLRSFVAFFIRRGDAATPRRRDPSLAAAFATNPALAAAYTITADSTAASDTRTEARP